MGFYLRLRERLKDSMDEKELELLPRSYQIVGKILLLKLKPELLKQKKPIGCAILELLPYLQTVCLQKHILDAERKPQIEVIAGEEYFTTLHRENGCLFEMDVSKSMFSKGNKAEKLRLASLIKPGETVVDMFAGIGYWSVPIAKLTGAEKVFAIDISSDAVKFLERNAFLNNVSDKIKILKGDCRDFAGMLENTADRVIMGCLFGTEKFLPAALKMAKADCTIHFHRNVEAERTEIEKKNVAEIAKKCGCEVQAASVRRIKSYAPGIWHIVLDLKVRKKAVI